MKRLWLTLCAAATAYILFALIGPAQAAPQEVASLPYWRTCTAGTHVWVYTRDAAAGKTFAPGPSCLPDRCLSEAAAAVKALAIAMAPKPADAASAALAAAMEFDCNDPAVLAEQTPRGALCRERRQFTDAHLKDIGITSRWVKVGAEHAQFALASPNSVRYGTGSTWRQAQLQAGSYTCDNALLAVDPAPGVAKQCDVVETIDVQEPTCATPAPVYTHKVKPNGAVNDRPVYPFTNGVKGTTALVVNGVAVRATVGQPCDPSKAQAPSGTSTTDLYAAYAPAFAASAVTLCTKQ